MSAIYMEPDLVLLGKVCNGLQVIKGSYGQAHPTTQKMIFPSDTAC